MTWSKHLEEYHHMEKEETKTQRGEQLASENKIFLKFIWPTLLQSSKHLLLKEKHSWFLLPVSLCDLKWDMCSQYSCRRATQHHKAAMFGQHKSAKESWRASKPPRLLTMENYSCKPCQQQMSTAWHLQ